MIFKQRQPLIDSCGEALLLHLNDALYIIMLQFKLGINGGILCDDGVNELREEAAFDAEQPAVARRAAQQPAQNIAPALV